MSTAKTILAASHGDGELSRFIVARENPSSLVHAARTTVAAVVSYLIARLFRLPEAYWAPISTLIGMQSTLGASLPVSVQHFAGTAVGAAIGANPVAVVVPCHRVVGKDGSLTGYRWGVERKRRLLDAEKS